MKDRISMTLEEFKTKITDQGVDILNAKFICPKCQTHQSAQELIDAGAGQSLDDVEKYLGFSCIGRFDESKGCDWTLGGLFQFHELEVNTPDGEKHPRFMPA